MILNYDNLWNLLEKKLLRCGHPFKICRTTDKNIVVVNREYCDFSEHKCAFRIVIDENANCIRLQLYYRTAHTERIPGYFDIRWLVEDMCSFGENNAVSVLTTKKDEAELIVERTLELDLAEVTNDSFDSVLDTVIYVTRFLLNRFASRSKSYSWGYMIHEFAFDEMNVFTGEDSDLQDHIYAESKFGLLDIFGIDGDLTIDWESYDEGDDWRFSHYKISDNLYCFIEENDQSEFEFDREVRPGNMTVRLHFKKNKDWEGRCRYSFLGAYEYKNGWRKCSNAFYSKYFYRGGWSGGGYVGKYCCYPPGFKRFMVSDPIMGKQYRNFYKSTDE